MGTRRAQMKLAALGPGLGAPRSSVGTWCGRFCIQYRRQDVSMSQIGKVDRFLFVIFYRHQFLFI